MNRKCLQHSAADNTPLTLRTAAAQPVGCKEDNLEMKLVEHLY